MTADQTVERAADKLQELANRVDVPDGEAAVEVGPHHPTAPALRSILRVDAPDDRAQADREEPGRQLHDVCSE